MINEKKQTLSRKSPSRRQLKEARSEQYKGDYRFYKLFAQIWGWDRVKADPEKAVNKLCKYIKREEQKRPVKRQRPRDPELQFSVGVAYLSGWIPDEEYENKAAMWFARSYEQGCDKGALGIGYIKEHGMAGNDPKTDLDYRCMVDAYTSAAKQGNVYAQYRLANILYHHDPDNLMIIQPLKNAVDAGYQPAKELFAKISLRPKKTPVSAEQQMISSAQYDELRRILIEIEKDAKAGRAAAEGAVSTIRRVEVTIQTLQAGLKDMWAEHRETEKEHIDELKRLQEQVNAKLNRTTHDQRKEAENFMAILFGSDWREPSRLCKESCDALVTARVLMKTAEQLDEAIFAGIVMSAVWPLEHEMRRRFYDAFNRYLEEKGIAKPDCMYLDGDSSKPEVFTLGSLSHIVNSTEFDDFAKEHLLSDAAKEAKNGKGKTYDSPKAVFKNYKLPGRKKPFIDSVIKLNNKYRTSAAHAGIVTRDEAVACCKLLGILDVKGADEQMCKVESLLKDLLWLTKPLEVNTSREAK